MSDYLPVCVGKCLHCEKEVYTFDNPDYNWLDGAAFVELVNESSCRIVGSYGSATMDLSSAEFTDYELFEKCLSEMRNTSSNCLYLCDGCVEALLKEGRIAYSSEFRSS